MVKSFFSFATFLKQENNGQPDVKGRGIQLQREAVYEEMRAQCHSNGFRCPLPQYMERPLVDSCSVLFGSLRSHLWGQAKRAVKHF
jgi:hypothetical protein